MLGRSMNDEISSFIRNGKKIGTGNFFLAEKCDKLTH